MLVNGPCFRTVVEHMADYCEKQALHPDILACPEARGFIFGAALAYRLGVGFVPIRKPNKLPHDKVRLDYDLEYGTDGVEMHKDAITAGQRVILVDDLLATGGTMSACAQLVASSGAEIIACLFLVELNELRGREKLPYTTHALLSLA